MRLPLVSSTLGALAIVSSTLPWQSDAPQQQQSPDTVLLKLREFDSTINGVTIGAHVLNPLFELSPDSERLSVTTKIAIKNGLWATRSDTDPGMAKPEYMQPVRKGPNVGRHGNMLVSRPSRRFSLRENDFLGMYQETQVFTVDPQSNVSQTDAGPRVELYNPSENPYEDDQGVISVVMLTAGRTFGGLIQRIISVAARADGMLECNAVGHYLGGEECRWDLLIEPQAAYMVRSARGVIFGDVEIAKMENQGCQWFAKGPLPQRGSFWFANGELTKENCESFEITFVDMADTADESLITHNRQLLRREFPKGMDILDYRSGGLKRWTVGEVPTIAEPEAETSRLPTPHSRAHIWYLIMAANAFVALLWAVWRYRRAMNVESTP